MDSRQKFVSDRWNTKTVPEIAAELGATTSSVYRIATKLRLPSQAILREERKGPSVEEIARRAAVVRSRWTKAEEERRRVGWGVRYTIPCYRQAQIFPMFQGQGR